jgi:hypothetical protein
MARATQAESARLVDPRGYLHAPPELRRDRLLAYPGGTAESNASTGAVVLPLRYRRGDQELSFFSISAVVGTATDVTVDELAIESFYPANPTTMAALRARPARTE